MKGHMRAMNLIFDRGANQSNKDRVWQASELAATTIPLLGVTPKDHKPIQDNGDPKTRPLCFAKKTINGELSEFVSQILDPAANCITNSEVISTEECANKVDQFNRKLAIGQVSTYSGLVVGSLDATALYPSLDILKCAKLAAKRVVESKLKFEWMILNGQQST